MRCKRVDQVKLAPDASIWAQSERKSVNMMATPLGMQPTAYIHQSWQDKPYGQISTIDVAALHDGDLLAVRMSWQPVSGNSNKDFPDAVAFAIPVKEKPPLILMGTPEAPIHILHWREGRMGTQPIKDSVERVSSIIAGGIGKSETGPDIKCKVAVQRNGKRIDVVIVRPMGTGKNIAPVLAGSSPSIGFAVWDGGNEERAGIKAFSVDWFDLVLDA